ncbi:MAG: LamG-like jellyroll fold domain-containing protein, partial [Chloroflexota bacterium]
MRSPYKEKVSLSLLFIRYAARLTLLAFILTIISLVVSFMPRARVMQAFAPSAEQIVKQAWEDAQESGAYEFATELVQTTYPAPRLDNVGRSSYDEILYVEGQANWHDQQLQMTLWQDGNVLNRDQAIDLRVEGTEAFGRVGDSEWEPVDNISGAFAPGQDLLAFLAGASNIQFVGAETRTTPVSISYARYSFNLDGGAFAVYMRDQFEQQLRSEGRLPAGIHLDTADIYRTMIGDGELWLDSDGLPLRLLINGEFPQQQNGQRIKLKVKTDFSNFDRQFIQTRAAPQTWGDAISNRYDSLARTTGLPRTSQGWGLFGSRFFSVLLVVGLGVLFLATAQRSKIVYRSFAIAMILSLVSTPLLQAASLHDFHQYMGQHNDGAEARHRQAEVEQAQAEAESATHWDPRRDPLAGIDALPQQPDTQPASAPSYTGGVETTVPEGLTAACPNANANIDADNDGLNQLQECLLNSVNGSGLESDSDHDNDGLTDLQESRLGTSLSLADSDEDGIRDDAEVQGYTIGNKTWYSNPMSPDSNEDGIVDTLECWSNPPTSLPSALDCNLDTDGDGLPDLFDEDNDGDGVFDAVDMSPFDVAGTFNADTPFKFTVDNLASQSDGKAYPIIADFQVRPDNAEHLTYALNVLDWPSGDSEGNVTTPSVTETVVFADFMNPTDAAEIPSAAQGDLRLVPMMEFKFDTKAVPMITAEKTYNFAENTVEGSLTLRQNGAHISVSGSVKTGKTYTLSIESGPCLAGNEAKHTDSVTQFSVSGSNINQTVSNKYLTNLANSQHVIYLYENADKSNTACQTMVDLPNGGVDGQMVDTELLQAYGVSIRDINGANVPSGSPTLSAYAPLNVVSDQSGGGRVAFMARMPFQPDQASQWGVNSEVRVVWMIQKLELSGNTSVIHTYQDDWKLTGLSMREDRGVKVGLIFEDPEKDSNTNYDNYLFQVAHILERSFVGGRTDVSLDDIKDEFDHQTNTDSPIRVKFANDGQWYETQEEIAKVMMTESKAVLTDHFSGVESPSLMFATESALRVRGLADVSANANSVYTINFVGSQVANSTSLSWAPYQYENNAWSAFPIDEYWETLDLKIPDAAFDSDPETTVGGKGLLKAYYLAIHNGLSTASNPEDFGSVVAAATDFPSFDEILADEWENVITSNQETIAEKLGEKIAKKIFKDKEETANSQSATGGAASEGTSDTGSSDAGSGSQNDNLPRNSSDVPKNWMGSVGQRFSAAVDRRISSVENSPRFQKWGPRGEQALGVASAAAGIANFIALSTGSKEAETAVGYANSGITIINSTIETVTTVKDTLEDVRKLKDVDGLKEVTKATRSSAKAGTITLIIGEAINYGVFITQMILTKTKFGSLAFNDALATAIANTIVAVALFVLALAVPVGTIISAIIGVIDALIAGLCAAADEVVQHVNDDDKNFSEDNPAGKRICAGISGLAGALVKLFIYSQRPLVGNVNSPNRLKIFGLDLDFVPGSEGKGFSTSSNLQVSLGLTNTIVRSTMLKTDNADACFSTDDEGNCLSEWQTAVENDIIPLPFDPLALPFFWQYSDRNAKKATFKYALQRNKSDIHKDLKMDDHTDEWKDVAGKDRQFYILRENISSQFDLQATGINRPLGIYLAEGYAVPNQECFLIPNPVPLFPVPPYIPICHIRADKKTKHIPLDSVKNDIFPPTLAAFYEAVSKDGGYAMAWGQTGDLTFPTIEDFDGDGLPYANDPNDSRWDTDGDGLNDNYEIARGYDPQDNDSDNDCLSDGQEARHGLNPLRADSDGDGLKDAQEIAIYPRTANCGIDGELGWSVTYQLNPELVTRMWSDPLSADQDGDNITDALEKNRGFSPYAADTDTVLTYEADLNETTAPSLLLRFDERVGAASFADTSGNGLTVRCVGNNCPVAGHQGRFLNALNFDGDDDYVTIADSPEFDFGTGPFAITMWLKKQDNSRADIFNWKNDEGDDVGITLENGKIRMLIRLDTVGGIAVSNNNTVDFGEWFHLAIVRNDQGAIKMYIDGIERGSGTSNADFGQMDVGTTLRLGANRSDLNGSSPTNLLEGMMDEVGIFPYALSAGQVVSVMNARYNLDDNIVGAGDSLTYTGRATNELLGRYAQGILTTDIEDAEISGTARQSFILEPRQSQTMAGTFNVGTNTPSGNYTVHQSALANVRDWKSQSGQAALWLNFESNRDDTSGNQPPRNATCSGSSCPGYRDGIRGRASSFDGSNDYLQVAHTTGLHPSRLTVSVWAKSDTTNWNSNDSLISKQHAYLLQPKFGTKTVDFSVYLGGDWHTVSVDLTEDIRNWHHYAATFDGTTLRLYVDGLLRESNGPFSGLSRTNTS